MSISIHHVVFAALMHDIGKVVQRSGASDVPAFIDKCRKDPRNGVLGYKHAMWTADFLSRHPINLPDQEWDIIVELAGSHHCKDSWKMHNLDVYLDMIIHADRLSSSWDREDSEDASSGTKRYLKVPLYSVFSRVFQDQSKSTEQSHWAYPIKKLTPDSAYPKQGNTLRDQSEDYAALLSAFETDYAEVCKYFNNLSTEPDFARDHFPQFIDAVDGLLKQYFWCVPANTMEQNPVGSLYHHLHNSATITAALYAKHTANNHQEDFPFMVITADMNGIQNYLYDLNPENSSKAGKLLRSRSFQIQMIMEMAAAKVIKELGISHLSVFANHGGKWFMLAHNSPENRSTLEELKRLFNRELYKAFLGTVSLNLNWETKLGLADLRKEHFLNTIQKCFDAMEREKHAKFASILQSDGAWQSDEFVVNTDVIYNDQICDFCKRRISDDASNRQYAKYESPDEEQTRICSTCLREIRLGRNLAQKKNFKISSGDARGNAYISFAGMSFLDASDDELERLLPAAHYFSLDPNLKSRHIPLRVLATQVPIKNDRVRTFEEIAETSEGLFANAILKGDVDNLGYMMSRAWHKNEQGLPQCSITEFSTTSFLMDYFFSAVLPELIKKEYPDSIYTVYSGGDDFCLVGAYDKVIDFANKLSQKFKAYCAMNPNIHFSAAIALSHSKEPIKFMIKSTDERLDDAKGVYDKDSLNLYETIVKWKDLPDLMEFSAKLSKWLKDGDITLQFLYRLLAYHQMYIEAKTNPSTNLRNYLYDSLLNYDIKRNIQKIKNDRITNPELVETLKNLTGLQEGGMMKHLRIPLCHAIYKHRKSRNGENHE